MIRRRWAELALSLRALAAQCGVAAPFIIAVENDRNHHDLSIGFVVKLARALALDPAGLRRDPPKPTRTPTIPKPR
jgi:hypothetical protein